MAYKILLVEDNPHIMEINAETLRMENYDIIEAPDGKTCLAVLQLQDVDLAILDIMLPDADGLELCRKIKQEYDIPIIFLSALGENRQIIDGLRAGGDDYLPKPYDLDVLIARVEARLRGAKRRDRFVCRDGLKLDTLSMTGYYVEKDLLLTQKEFLLLRFLSEKGNEYIAPDELYLKIWGAPAVNDRSALHATISRVNKKLDGVNAGIRVSYIRGEGYALEEI